MTMVQLPLERFQVLDLTHARAGPTAVRHLADWGARVIKIERPGDGGRDGLAGARHGFDFQNLHRNKRSLTLDLKAPEGKAIFFRLAEKADVIAENMRAGVKHRLGIDYAAVRRVNPRIVYGSISGFGQDGPYAERAGVDQIAQGMGGLMSITGLPGQGPVRVGIPIADLTAGGFLAQAIMVALLEREVTGEGRFVHTSLLEAEIGMLDFQATRWLIKGEVAPQAGNDHPTGIPTGLFPAADGQINIAAAGGGIFQRFCRAVGMDALIDDPRFATAEARSRNRQMLNAIIADYTKTRRSEELILALNAAGVPCGPIYTIDQVFADPQVQHLAIARPVDHPRLGRITVVAQPNNLEGVDKSPRRPTPELGEHTDEILGELGFDAAAIAELRTKRVV
jgi:crotonobetainyl-CoA:carnitine CoA-transferase CaiB-like acyl-CoA transferase